MKIRNGFVSNSSSSSFILAFDHKPESESDLANMIFGEEYNPDYRHIYLDETWTITNRQIVSKIYADITNGQPERYNVGNDLVDIVRGGYIPYKYDVDESDIDDGENLRYDRDFSGMQPYIDEEICKRYQEVYARYYNCDRFKYGGDEDSSIEAVQREIDRDTLESEYMNMLDEMASAIVKNFKAKNEGKFIVALEYGDRYVGETVLEHKHLDILKKIPHIGCSNH